MLKPIFEAQCASALSSSVIAMDETTIKAGPDRPREDAPGVLLAGLR